MPHTVYELTCNTYEYKKHVMCDNKTLVQADSSLI